MRFVNAYTAAITQRQHLFYQLKQRLAMHRQFSRILPDGPTEARESEVIILTVTGGNIGEYLDPSLIAGAGPLASWQPSVTVKPAPDQVEVPLVDGRTAVVNSEGIIVDIR